MLDGKDFFVNNIEICLDIRFTNITILNLQRRGMCSKTLYNTSYQDKSNVGMTMVITTS